MPGRVHPGVELRNTDGTVNLSPTGEISAPGSSQAGRTFDATLTSDAAISVTAATPIDTFPPGQPVTLLEVAVPDLRAGDVLVTVSGSFYLVVDDAATEDQPQLQLQLWVDGAQVAEANSTNLFYWIGGFPTLLNAISVPGNILKRVPALAAGAHTFQLRWGVKGGTDNPGSAPACSGLVFISDGHATLVVQEVAS